MKRDEIVVSNQVLDELKRYTEDLLSFFGLKAAVKISTEESDPTSNMLDINIADSDLSRLLVGYRGRNLNALQHIVTAFAHTKWPEQDLKVHVDIGQYRAKQIEQLLEKAKEQSSAVLNSGQTKELIGLNSLERRVVHKYISDNYSGKLVTESSGQGSERRLLIKTVN